MMRILLLLLSIFLINVSCIKDVDINQVESATFQIPTDIALLKLDLTQDDFLDNNNNVVHSFQQLFLINLDGLFWESTTESLDLVTQFTNTFDRDFLCRIEFINEENIAAFTTPPFPVPAGSTVTQEIFCEEERFDAIYHARRMNVVINLRSNDPMDPFDDRELQIQSVINYMFEFVTPSNNQ